MLNVENFMVYIARNTLQFTQSFVRLSPHALCEFLLDFVFLHE